MKHLIWRALRLRLAGTALAQQGPAPMRVRGQIEKVDGHTLTVKARDDHDDVAMRLTPATGAR